LQPSFKTCNGTLWVNFAGDAPPSIARQPQSLLYLLLLLAWLFHSVSEFYTTRMHGKSAVAATWR
jgi:hypothetical protein